MKIEKVLRSLGDILAPSKGGEVLELTDVGKKISPTALMKYENGAILQAPIVSVVVPRRSGKKPYLVVGREHEIAAIPLEDVVDVVGNRGK